MAEYSHPVLVSGPYQIIALMQAPEPDPAWIAGYAVTTACGAILRRDLTLYEARAWLELLLESDAMPALPMSLAKASRARR